ncbi:MAG: tellurite resistance protein permease [Rhodococcus sp.]|nr:tellurite resistance protein permease [Rhodococcus sp. (in: high G+C Gram-positive bacteria)]
MAGGIISVGLQLQGFHIPSLIVLAVAVTGYVILLVLTGWRFVRFRAEMIADLIDARHGFRYFTFVAGTNVLAVRSTMSDHHLVAAVLFVVAAAAWGLLGYMVPWAAILGTTERPVIARANGTWFIWVVASQSVAVSAAVLELVYVDARAILAGIAVVSWSVGVFLYAAVGVFVGARMLLYPFGPADLTGPYWVSMGACAITVLAGSRIIEMASAPMVEATRGLIYGLAVLFWAFAAWLIPVLVAAGWWRHVVKRIPLRYDPSLWSIVFPVGMFAVASIYLGDVEHLPLVRGIGTGTLIVAVFVWAAALALLLHHLWCTFVRRSTREQP